MTFRGNKKRRLVKLGEKASIQGNVMCSKRYKIWKKFQTKKYFDSRYKLKK